MQPSPGGRNARTVLAASLGIGVAAGAASGLLGVGGGIVMVPLLTAGLGFSQHSAHATSLAAIVPIAIVSGATFAVAGEIDLGVAALLSAGAVLGAPLGATMMARAGEGLLKALFGLLLLAVSIELLWP